MLIEELGPGIDVEQPLGEGFQPAEVVDGRQLLLLFSRGWLVELLPALPQEHGPRSIHPADLVPFLAPLFAPLLAPLRPNLIQER